MLRYSKTRQLVRDALLLALLVVSAYINLTILAIPVTLQLFIVFLIIIWCDWQDALIITGLYFLMGICGIPVFSGATSGITPTIGFVIGFVVACLPMSILRKKHLAKSEIIENLIFCLVALVIVYICGFAFYMIYTKNTLQQTLSLFLIFIGIDTLKAIVAAILGYKIQNIIDNQDRF